MVRSKLWNTNSRRKRKMQNKDKTEREKTARSQISTGSGFDLLHKDLVVLYLWSLLILMCHGPLTFEIGVPWHNRQILVIWSIVLRQPWKLQWILVTWCIARITDRPNDLYRSICSRNTTAHSLDSVALSGIQKDQNRVLDLIIIHLSFSLL